MVRSVWLGALLVGLLTTTGWIGHGGPDPTLEQILRHAQEFPN